MKIPADCDHGTDAAGRRIVYCEEKSPVRGVKRFRRMTDQEIERFEKSKDGKTKVRPAKIKGTVRRK